MVEQNYLGKGEKYSLQKNAKGEVALISGAELIEQAMKDILTTPKGTILNLEYYGSKLHLLNFTQNDSILISLLIFFISECLFDCEKRSRVLGIECINENNVVYSYITYRILASNEVNTFVYPYYKEIKN